MRVSFYLPFFSPHFSKYDAQTGFALKPAAGIPQRGHLIGGRCPRSLIWGGPLSKDLQRHFRGKPGLDHASTKLTEFLTIEANGKRGDSIMMELEKIPDDSEILSNYTVN